MSRNAKNLFWFCVFSKMVVLHGELWEEDLSSAMKIGLSTTGYKSVDLRCDADHFSVNITLEEDFEGVVYTRGSFNDKQLPCFRRRSRNGPRLPDQLVITLRIPFHKCKTIMDVAESRYTNTLVVQHDPELIMPGDAAFALDCAFVPEFKVGADVATDPGFKSKITLVDADPSENTNLDKHNLTAFSKSEKVSFVPESVGSKDEL